MSVHTMNIYAKFFLNSSIMYEDIALTENGRPYGRSEYPRTYCLHRGFFNGGGTEDTDLILD